MSNAQHSVQSYKHNSKCVFVCVRLKAMWINCCYALKLSKIYTSIPFICAICSSITYVMCWNQLKSPAFEGIQRLHEWAWIYEMFHGYSFGNRIFQIYWIEWTFVIIRTRESRVNRFIMCKSSHCFVDKDDFRWHLPCLSCGESIKLKVVIPSRLDNEHERIRHLYIKYANPDQIPAILIKNTLMFPFDKIRWMTLSEIKCLFSSAHKLIYCIP